MLEPPHCWQLLLVRLCSQMLDTPALLEPASSSVALLEPASSSVVLADA
jgi:hypothetical protein